MAVDVQKPLDTGLPAKPEPSDVIDDMDLRGKRVVITGGYSGIGLETTRALANAGAQIIIPARTMAKATEALSKIEGDILAAPMDLADLSSIHTFTEQMLADGAPIDMLINNAGVMACPERRIGPGWEAQFATNHLGHFALTKRLTPLLQKAKGARIVCLSSVAHRRSDIVWDDLHFHTRPYDKWSAYAQAKTANALHAVALNARLKDDGVRTFAVHPGGILTPLQRHLPREEMMALGWVDSKGEIAEAAAPFFKTPAQGCATTLWCALSPALNDKGGVYCEDCNIAAIGDPAVLFQGVEAHAVDTDSAARLWDVSEAMLRKA